LVFDKINVTDQATGTTTQKLTDSLTTYYKNELSFSARSR
jgi:hypothetical protein